ncbi:putative cyclin-D7-1 isoform X1 [Macadamia integrifolia]|uniref:putative cyclin-D7-1 isoform X1 n=1 Tax=Macadamia integrifolia TaxID=60698 RepID=UPI001C4EE6AF|nr:putative cyclin-D7-1 isoform X1 [Macadamia integrifolia]
MESLLCDEDWLRSPVQPYPIDKDHRLRTTNVVDSFYTTREDRENALKVCLQKEIGYLPESGYVDRLQSLDLMATRFKAVRWFIKSLCLFDLSLGTVFNAVNYFDRFVSTEFSQKWENWMIESMSVACLSIAAKFGEVSIPLIQIWENHDGSLKPSTIQRMELKVFKALGWRLNCVTPYSYVELLTCHLDSLQPRLHADLSSRLTELLLATLSDPKFLEFRPCTIAVSAFRCSLEEVFPSKADKHISSIQHLIPIEFKEDMEKCYKAMEERLADPLYNGMVCEHPYGPSSPITVITKETTMDHLGLFDLHRCCLNFNNVFDSSPLYSISNPKKRRREEEEGCMVSS